MLRYFTIFILLTLLGYLYDKYKLKQESQDELSKYDLVKNFILNDDTNLSGKPILWIHNDYKTNARWWPSFFSRNTNYLNQPYLQLCVESIINCCGNSFNICLIDDNSFRKLIPDWKIDFNTIANPIKTHMRTLAMSRVLYYYGGLLIPNSTLVLKDLINLYNKNLTSQDVFTFECIDRNSTSTYTSFFPNIKFLGCKKHSPTIKALIHYLEVITSQDYTSEMDFLGQTNRWLFEQCQENKIGIIGGDKIGIKNIHNKPVYIEDILGNTYIPYDDTSLHAIYLPADEILSRTKYAWFARMSPSQVLQSNTIIAKYFILSQGSK